MKDLKGIVVVLGVIGLGLFLFILLLGLANPNQPEIPGKLFSDNWFYAAHPIWFGVNVAVLLYIFSPIKFRFRRKEKQA